MGYRLEGRVLGDEVRRVADEETAKAVSALHEDDVAFAVHEARRRLKRLRALLRLARAPLGARYGVENERLRDLGRRLAAPRDARVMAETFDRLFRGERSREVVALRELLEGRIAEATPEEETDSSTPGATSSSARRCRSAGACSPRSPGPS